MTSTQLTGGQWVGPAVRVQNSGQNGYLGIYYWNSGSPELMLYKRSAGNWTQLGSTLQPGRWRPGRSWSWRPSGSTISFLVDGAPRISVTDSSFTGGAPGIMAHGSATADNWSGGTAASYSVGGAVSGLSGTVVLQDNGGDDLSRQRERVVHVRDSGGQRRGLQRDGEDEPVRAVVHGLQRVGHGGLGERH